MIDPSGAEVVFAELERAYGELITHRRFPARFRRAFDEYLYKSQQLTEVMRREYRASTGKAWIAANFDGWNAYTAALKAIRNAVVHGTALQLHETILAVYPAVLFKLGGEDIGPRQTAAGVRLVKSTCFVDQPFQERFITSHVGFPAQDGGHVFPLREFASYELQWELLEAGARSAVDQAGTRDVVRLVLGSYPVLCRYYSHYRTLLEENQWARA